QRQVSADDDAVTRLPRRDFSRDLRRYRIHDEGAHGDDAHAGADAVPAERLPAAAGHRDAAPAHAAPLRVGAGGRTTPVAASGRRLGQLSGPGAVRDPEAGAALSAARGG